MLITKDHVQGLDYEAGESLEDLGFTYNETFLDGFLHGSDKWRKYASVYHEARINDNHITLSDLLWKYDEDGVVNDDVCGKDYYDFIVDICNLVPEYNTRFIECYEIYFPEETK